MATLHRQHLLERRAGSEIDPTHLRRKPSRHWKQNLIVLSAAQFLSMVGMSFFLPFIPLYMSELGISDPSSTARWSGLIVASGYLMLAVLVPFWGYLADRFGRKFMVVRAMATASVILLLSSMVRTPIQLLALRCLHGCFSGFVSAAIALIATETPLEALGFGMGVFQSALAAGFIVGPFLGGALQDAIGIRPTIVGGGIFLLIGTAMVFLLVKERNKPKANVPKGNAWANTLLVFSDSTLGPAAIIQFLSNLAMMLVQPILALFVGVLSPLPRHLGMLSGLVVSASAVSMVIGAPIWGRIADRMGQRWVLMFCLIASGLLFIPQGLAQSVPQLLVSRLLVGFFTGGIAPALQSVIAQNSPVERRAGILGISFSVTLFGNGFGPLVGGFLASAWGIRVPFLFVAFVFLLTGILTRSLNLSMERVSYTPVPELD